jgi:hypothetical protein
MLCPLSSSRQKRACERMNCPLWIHGRGCSFRVIASEVSTIAELFHLLGPPLSDNPNEPVEIAIDPPPKPYHISQTGPDSPTDDGS